MDGESTIPSYTRTAGKVSERNKLLSLVPEQSGALVVELLP